MSPTPPPGFYFFIAVFWLVVSGTILMVLYKLAVWWGERHADMSSAPSWDDMRAAEDRPMTPATTRPQNSNNGIATPATDSNGLLLQGKAQALAAMVKAGKVGETEGIKLVFGVAPSSSNLRYQAARAALKESLANQEKTAQFPPLTPEQHRAREALGLEKR